MYQALYRKWRPRTFDDVVGQEHITETLKRQLTSGRLSHAYLFVGTRGTGKTTCAKLLARAVNCEEPQDGNPCNKCPSCLGIESGAVLDVEELDAASNNGVDNIRALRDEAVFTPASVKKRVYIVDEVHMLSTAAFNALLKILEEPPPHLIFILATTELQKVPATILSRCQRFSFKRIPPSDIADRLLYVASQEKLELTEGAAGLLSRLADGSMRDALSLLDQCAFRGAIDEDTVCASVGLAGARDTEGLLSLIADGDADGALSLLGELYYGGKDPCGALTELCALCRDALIFKVAPKGGDGLMSGSYAPSVVESFAKLLSRSRLLRIVNTIQSAVQNAAKSSERRTAAEMCVIELADPRCATDVAALCARVEELERELENGATTRLPESIVIAEQDLNVKPEPAPQQEPEPEPVAEPEDTPEPSPIEPESQTDRWPDIFKEAKGGLTPPQRMILDSRDNTAAEYAAGVLTVFVKNAFAENVVNIPSVTTALKSAAERVTGKPCSVRVEKTGQRPERDTGSDDKLSRLGRFSNVKFE